MRRRGDVDHEIEIEGYADLTVLDDSGGYATVYTARDVGLNRTVAIKVLIPKSGKSVDLEQFEKESKAIGALSSAPNVVTVYSRSVTDKKRYPYIVMELCSHSFKSEILNSPDRQVPLERAFLVGEKVAGALHEAHKLKILHRDIKPANILVTHRGDPVLGDFGIASLGEATEADAWTLHYTAPESIEGQPYTEACDIYSLGVTIYYALTGRLPFSYAAHGIQDREARKRAIAAAVINDPPPPIGRSDLAQELESKVLSLLAKHANDRPRNAAEVRALFRLLKKRSGSKLIDVDDETQTRSRWEAGPDKSSSAQKQHSPVDRAVPEAHPVTPDDLASTIHRSKRKATSEFLEQPPSQRPKIAFALLGVAVLVVAVGLLFGLRGRKKPPPAQPTPVPVTTVEVPTVVDVPIPDVPDAVEVTVGEEMYVVSWKQVSDADKYRVFTTDGKALISKETSVEFAIEDYPQPFCVQVTSANEQGRESRKSELTCSN